MKSDATTIAVIRDNITTLRRERDTLTAQSRSRNEVRAHVERQIAAMQAEGEQQAARNLVLLAYGETPPLVTANVTGVHAAANLGPVMAALHGADRLRAYLLAGLDQIPEGLDAAAKAERLGEIEAELVDLETREEALIVKSENDGQPIARRPDARPEIVLALQP